MFLYSAARIYVLTQVIHVMRHPSEHGQRKVTKNGKLTKSVGYTGSHFRESYRVTDRNGRRNYNRKGAIKLLKYIIDRN